MTIPTDAELVAFATEEQFLLFCDPDEFTDIARAVLAKWGQPQAVAGGEPVKRVFIVATGEEHEGEATYTRYDDAPPPLCDSECLYTAPPPQAVREPLTDEQVRRWWQRENGLEDCDLCKLDDFMKVARAVEAAHGITKGGQHDPA